MVKPHPIRVIAVASGKGGVGKSTVVAALARLAARGQVEVRRDGTVLDNNVLDNSALVQALGNTGLGGDVGELDRVEPADPAVAVELPDGVEQLVLDLLLGANGAPGLASAVTVPPGCASSTAPTSRR